MEQLVNVTLINEYIETNRLTEKEFCKQCKISTSAFYKIMEGKDFNLISLFRIAKRMNVDLCRFFQ